MNLIDMYNIGIYMVDIEYKIQPQHNVDNLMIIRSGGGNYKLGA